MLTAKRSQRTLAKKAGLSGVSFLSGLDVSLRFTPGEPDTGVVFVRTDLGDGVDVPATISHVVSRQRRTAIERDGATIEMVEHIMAALLGLRIDNCRVEINGPETPGCDGSSQAFVEALQFAGTVEQAAHRQAMVIEKPVTVREGRATLTAHPGETKELVVTYTLDYGPQTAIGRQSLFMEVTPDSFVTELGPSRTFLLEAEAETLRQSGIGARTTTSDLLIFGPDGPIGNALRYPDECVRHKMLDLVGDLALFGHDLVGHVVAHRSGHSLNAELVRKLAGSLEKTKVQKAEHSLDIGAIMKILPHRYPFLLVDRVLSLEPSKRIVAIKNVTVNEPFFQGHWPGRPIMPGVMIVEALAQAAGVMLSDRVDSNESVAVIAAINHVKIRRPVTPGDQLRLEVEAVKLRDRCFDVQGIAKVDGHRVAEAAIKFMVLPAERVA